jgi:oxygen-independent coproporphyrinogen-3 oxidase
MRTAELPHDAYATAVLRELDARSDDLQGRSLTSVFFGGGTPSLWEADALGRTLAGIRSSFETEAADLEVTVECNPSSLDRAHAARLVERGVNRLSIGVQSLRDTHLGFLGRLHDSSRASFALEEAVAEVPRVSADLMFGMPGQTTEELRDDIASIADTGVSHVSAYSLTIEEKTLFGSLSRAGKLRVAPEERYVAMFEDIEETFSNLGWRHYEVSNYAPPGEESRTRSSVNRGCWGFAPSKA